jgi:hypothetical protein
MLIRWRWRLRSQLVPVLQLKQDVVAAVDVQPQLLRMLLRNR